jgi:hypothetical protein
MESLNKTDVSVRSCPCISLTEALQRSRAPNFAKIQIMTMDKRRTQRLKKGSMAKYTRAVTAWDMVVL